MAGIKKPNRLRKQDAKGRKKRAQEQSGRGLKQTLPRHAKNKAK
ncbi:MAG: hypothetical protein WD850_02550 [Candidatus Spechtbacterales bacterium]